MRKLSLFIALITTLLAITPAEYQKELKIGINVNWCNFNKYVKMNIIKSAQRNLQNSVSNTSESGSTGNYMKKTLKLCLNVSKVP